MRQFFSPFFSTLLSFPYSLSIRYEMDGTKVGKYGFNVSEPMRWCDTVKEKNKAEDKMK